MYLYLLFTKVLSKKNRYTLFLFEISIRKIYYIYLEKEV